MRRARGFTLIELMVVVTVVAILVGIAYPSYQSYLVKSRRSEAHQLMTEIASRETQYILDARTYTNKLDSTGLNIGKQGWTCSGTSCQNTFYTITVTPDNAATPPTFTITATPKAGSAQASDGNLTLSHTGAKGGKW